MTIQDTYYTVGQAAAELGMAPGGVWSAIRRGALTAETIGPRVTIIARDELERYRREHQGGQGWEKRKAPDYEPSKMAGWAKDYRARRKAAAQAEHSSEGASPSEG